jgi:uroporphyrinogen-III synthase
VIRQRPRHQVGRLATRLRARGIGCLIEPLLEISPLPWEVAAILRGQHAILLSSPNAAEALLRAIAAGMAGGLAAPPPLLAVGAATARPLRRAGLARVEAAGGDAADLLRLVQARLDPICGALAYLSGETLACGLAVALTPAGVVRLLVSDRDKVVGPEW